MTPGLVSPRTKRRGTGSVSVPKAENTKRKDAANRQSVPRSCEVLAIRRTDQPRRVRATISDGSQTGDSQKSVNTPPQMKSKFVRRQPPEE